MTTEQPTNENADPCYFHPFTHDFRAMVIIWLSAIMSCAIVAGLIYWIAQ